MPRGRPQTSPPAGFRAFSTPRQTEEGPRPHLRSPVPPTRAEESKASPAPALLNRRLSFLSGSATLQRPQSHSKSQFPAGTWRWAHSGELHQAAGIKGGEAWLKPKLRSALPSRGRECGSKAGGNRWDEGCRRRAGHHPNTQSSLSWLCPNCIPVLWALALGVREVAGKAHPHLSLGRDEVMGAWVTSPPPGHVHPAVKVPLFPWVLRDRSLLYRQRSRATK